MTGSLLITFNGNYPQYNQRGFEVTVNGEVRYVHYYSSNNLYTTYLNVGDVVTINNFNTEFTESFDVTRKDYTTDDEGGDRGIKETFITGVTGTNQTVTFTASTRADAYDFYYVIDTTINDCLTIGLGFGNQNNNSINEIKYKNNKLYFGGYFQSYNGNLNNAILTTNEDGSVFSGFTFPSLFTGTSTQNVVTSIEFQSDGKILYGGLFTSYSGQSRNRILRVNSDYTLDTGFTIGTGFNNSVYDIEIQSDGKIIAAGAFSSFSGITSQSICRLNSNGSLDNTFTSSLTGGTVYDISLYNDNKILYGGNNLAGFVKRLNSDGSIDNTFTTPNFSTLSIVYRTKILSDNKILISGELILSSQPTITYGLLRLNSDGSIDNTFNSLVVLAGVGDFDLTNENKIILVGDNPRKIIQLNYDGTIDTSFNTIFLYPEGFLSVAELECILIKPNTDIIIGGSFTGTSLGNYNRVIQIDKYGNNRMCEAQTYSVPTGATFYYDVNNITSYPGTGTTLFDLTANGYNASLNNGPIYVSTTPKYFNFDGVDDFGNVSNVGSYGSNTGNFTFGGWINLNNTANRTFLARGRDGSGDGWSIAISQFSSRGRVEIVTKPDPTVNVAVNAVSLLNTIQWFNIMGTWESGVGLKLYINGVLEGTTTSTRTILRDSTVYWDIARINTSYMDVDVSKIIVYHRVLTHNEIINYFQATKSIYGY